MFNISIVIVQLHFLFFELENVVNGMRSFSFAKDVVYAPEYALKAMDRFCNSRIYGVVIFDVKFPDHLHFEGVEVDVKWKQIE